MNRSDVDIREMIIIAVNCGSSTLKFQVFELGNLLVSCGDKGAIASGAIQKIGGSHSIIDFEHGGTQHRLADQGVPDHGAAVGMVLDWLKSVGLTGPDHVRAVGHRVVHGGDRFCQPTLIDDESLAAIADSGRLAPLHNKAALMAIRAAQAALGPSIPTVAVFDTEFHSGMPDHAGHYAIDQELALKHGIRRHGFHGTAHRYMTQRYAELTSRPLEQVKLITLQLGNGCSATAVENGRSVDTSMGLTPLEGLVMGTRCGDVDPTLAGFLSQQEGVDIEQVHSWLNTKSGLLGVSGRSADMRDLLAAGRQGDVRARLAVEMFCYRVRKYIGAYLAVLGGAEAVVFGGGIGEQSPEIRARICERMAWCGLQLDAEHNQTIKGGKEGVISIENASMKAYVIPVNEMMVIAQETARVIGNHRQHGQVH